VSIGDLIRRLAEKLDGAGVPYMVAGSFASTFHGIPRSTYDIDLVIDPSSRALDSFVTSLDPDEYYVDPDVARDALRMRSQFNVIDVATSWKVDCILRKDRPFSIEEFRRREPAELFGVTVFVSTAEDSIVAKLEWARMSDSERQLRDVAGILSTQAGRLDVAYVDRWVAELGLGDVWARVKPQG
jgi:hypothetical protein